MLIQIHSVYGSLLCLVNIVSIYTKAFSPVISIPRINRWMS